MEYTKFYNNPGNELYHHGIKGMKWGVRRYQNKDGSLTPAGKKRQAKQEYKKTIREIDAADGNRDRNRKIAKKVAAAVIMTATVSAAAAAYAKNPEAANRVLSKVGKTTVSALKKGGSKAVSAGKKYVNEAIRGAKDGFKEGAYEAPKKAVKVAMTGATLLAAKKMLDASVGKEESAKIFQANNNKKISSFWKVGPEDKDDDD